MTVELPSQVSGAFEPGLVGCTSIQESGIVTVGDFNSILNTTSQAPDDTTSMLIEPSVLLFEQKTIINNAADEKISEAQQGPVGEIRAGVAEQETPMAESEVDLCMTRVMVCKESGTKLGKNVAVTDKTPSTPPYQHSDLVPGLTRITSSTETEIDDESDLEEYGSVSFDESEVSTYQDISHDESKTIEDLCTAFSESLVIRSSISSHHPDLDCDVVVDRNAVTSVAVSNYDRKAISDDNFDGDEVHHSITSTELKAVEELCLLFNSSLVLRSSSPTMDMEDVVDQQDKFGSNAFNLDPHPLLGDVCQHIKNCSTKPDLVHDADFLVGEMSALMKTKRPEVALDTILKPAPETRCSRYACPDIFIDELDCVSPLTQERKSRSAGGRHIRFDPITLVKTYNVGDCPEFVPQYFAASKCTKDSIIKPIERNMAFHSNSPFV